MRNFMIDVWIWTKGKHSRPLKTIRFQMNKFPTEDDCERQLYSDKDIQFYLSKDMEITYNNLREYVNQSK